MDSLEIGYIYEYDTSNNTGLIKGYCDSIYPFYWTNLENNVNVADIVGFKLNNIEEAYDIRLAYNYTEEFEKLIKNSFNGYQCALVQKGVPKIYNDFLQEELQGKDKFLDVIDEHVDNTDIEQLINTYKVSVIADGFQRVGREDMVYVSIVSSSLPKKYNIDHYINSIFPKVDILIYEETAYTSYRTMLEKLNRDVDWSVLKLRAKKIEEENILKARSTYNKQEHRVQLNNTLVNQINQVIYNYNSKLDKLVQYWDYYSVLKRG